MDVLALFLGLIFTVLALFLIFMLIVKPLYEARKIILSYMVLSMVYLVVKAKAKVEHFQELRRRLIEAQMREREERKP